MLDETAVRDRYQQFSATARELLADFREVEENFRKLDRQLREKIAGWHGGKGELLDDVLGSRESIAGSDQGRSFQAFYDFLLSQARQEELSDCSTGCTRWPSIAESDPRLRHVHYDWLDAAERTQTTVRQLSEQLRRFLDDQVWFENRRVIDILRGIESRALELRETGNVPASRWKSTRRARHQAADGTAAVHPGPASPASTARRSAPPTSDETDPAALFEQVYVDPGPLRGGVRPALRAPRRSGSPSSSRAHPLTQGLAELVTYLSLRDEAFAIVYDDGTASRSAGRPRRPGADRHAAEGHLHQARRGG